MSDEQQRRTIPKLTKKRHNGATFDKRRLVAALYHQELGIEAEKPAQQATDSNKEEDRPCSGQNTTS